MRESHLFRVSGDSITRSVEWVRLWVRLRVGNTFSLVGKSSRRIIDLHTTHSQVSQQEVYSLFSFC